MLRSPEAAPTACHPGESRFPLAPSAYRWRVIAGFGLTSYAIASFLLCLPDPTGHANTGLPAPCFSLLCGDLPLAIRARAALQQGHSPAAPPLLRRAVERAPGVPAILLRAGMADYTSRRYEQALTKMKHVLVSVRDYDGFIFRLYRPLPAADLLHFGLPVRGEAASLYFRHVLAFGPQYQQRPIWNWLRAHGLADKTLLTRYLEVLRAGSDNSGAQEVLHNGSGADTAVEEATARHFEP